MKTTTATAAPQKSEDRTHFLTQPASCADIRWNHASIDGVEVGVCVYQDARNHGTSQINLHSHRASVSFYPELAELRLLACALNLAADHVEALLAKQEQVAA